MVHITTLLALASGAFATCWVDCEEFTDSGPCTNDCWAICPHTQVHINAFEGKTTNTVYFNDGGHDPMCVDEEGFSLRHIAATVHHCDYRNEDDYC